MSHQSKLNSADLGSQACRIAANTTPAHLAVVARWSALAGRILNGPLYETQRGVEQGSCLAVPIPGWTERSRRELCVYGQPGRMWSPGDIAVLNTMAHALSEELAGLTQKAVAERSAAELRTRNDIHKALVEASSSIIWQADPSGTLVEPSSSWQRFTGQTADECAGFGWLEAIHPDDRDGLRAHWNELRARPAKQTIEYRLKSASGEWRWMAECAVPLRDTDGTLAGWAGSSADVHERQVSSQRLMASEARYRALADATRHMIWILDQSGRVADESCDAWCAFTGQTRDDWQGRLWLDAVHPEDREFVATQWAATPLAEGATEYEYRLRHVSGDWRWVVERVAPLSNSEGQCIGWVGMTTDNTERKLVELDLVQSEARNRALVEASTQIVWVAGNDGKIQADSPSWRSFTGRPAEDWTGTRWLEDVHPDDRAAVEQSWKDNLETRSSRHTEYRLRRADGQWRWMHERAVPFGRPDSSNSGWVTMAVDVHDRKTADLRIQNRERHLALALKAARMAAWRLDLATWRITVEDDSGILKGSAWSDTVPFDEFVGIMSKAEGVHFRSLAEKAVTDKGALSFEFARFGSGPPVWLAASGQSIESPGSPSGVVRGVVCDITDRRLAEERRNLLVGEIAHRGKNLLAIIQSIASVTYSGDAAAADSTAKFQDRLASLARSHSLLTEKDWLGVPLDELVRLEIGKFGDRVELSVAPMILNPSAAQNCSLVLHELVTNAVKYGALSSPTGRVIVSALHTKFDGDDCITLTWTETGGPLVETPTRRGFGSTLLRRLIAGFDTEGAIEYRPEGVHLYMPMPIPMIKATTASNSWQAGSRH